MYIYAGDRHYSNIRKYVYLLYMSLQNITIRKVPVHIFYSLSMYYRSMSRGWGSSLTTLSGTGNPNQSVTLLQAKKGFLKFHPSVLYHKSLIKLLPQVLNTAYRSVLHI